MLKVGIIKKAVYYHLLLFWVIFFSSGSMLCAEVWDVTWQNDIIFGTDKNYTNGFKVGWGSDEIMSSSSQETTYRLSRYLKGYLFVPSWNRSLEKYYTKVSIFQDMYTPDDLSQEERIEDASPYAGHLYLKYVLSQVYKKSTFAYSASIGIVGPSSGAEQTQKFVHKATGSEEPKGWGNQLEDEVTYGIGTTYTYLVWGHQFAYGDDLDFFITTEGKLGNFIRSVSIGTAVRYGRNYPRILRVNSSIQGGASFFSYEYDKMRSDFGWVVSYGTFINTIGYFYITDKSDQYNVSRNTQTTLDMISLSLFYSGYELRFSIKETQFQDYNIRNSFGWGAISLSKQF